MVFKLPASVETLVFINQAGTLTIFQDDGLQSATVLTRDQAKALGQQLLDMAGNDVLWQTISSQAASIYTPAEQ